MKKIVILALHLDFGGVEKAIASLANILCENYKVKIISVYKISEKPAFFINEKVEIEYLLNNLKPNKEEFKKSVKEKNIIKIIKEAIKSLKILFFRKYKMIYAIKSLNCDIAISTRYIHNKLLGKYGNKKIIKIAQEHNHPNNNNSYVKKVVKSLKNINYLITVSEELNKFYENILRKKQIKTLYIPNFLDYFPENVSKLNEKQIISVGRLSSEKGFLDLIDVFNLVNKKYPDWNLKIIGDGSEKNKLKNKINNLNLNSNIKLLGFKNKIELNDIEMNSSIYVMTSFTESFGIVLIEAESYGLPILAFDSAQGANEVIKDGINGYLISKRDTVKMAEKICELIGNIELRKKLGNNGRHFAYQFKQEKIAGIWEDFLQKCLNKNK